MIVSTLYRRGDYDENELYGEERFYGGVQISVSNKPWLFQTTYNISILIRIYLYSALFFKQALRSSCELLRLEGSQKLS